jgi:hypothetical protein
MMRCVIRLGLLMSALWFASPAAAHGPVYDIPVIAAADVPADIRMTAPLQDAPGDIADLKFAEIHRKPVGPRGLEPTEAVLALDGKRVRMVGYMIALTPPTADAFMFAPLPAAVAVHDEGLADDIPPSTIYVRLPRFGATAGVAVRGIPQVQGLLKISGTLTVGSYADAITGRVFPASLELDAVPRRAFLELAKTAAERKSAVARPGAPPAILAGAQR